jgi:hypothetical protein
MTFLRQYRHRAAFKRLHKALFYHRYATAVLLAHEIGVFEALDRPRSVAEVAESCGIHERAADALLRILASQEMIDRGDHGYVQSEFAAAYLTRGGQFTMSSFLDLVAAQAASFGELPDGMKTGKVPSALDIFSADGRYPAYLGAVNGFLDLAGRDLLGQIELPEIQSFIVGSMGVSFSGQILKRHPKAKVTYGCLEHLVREIPRLRREYKIPLSAVDGMHAHAGDPSKDTWGDEGYDLVFLTKKMILEPEQRIGEKFAAKAFDVLKPGGVTIFWETIHSDDCATPLSQAMEAVLDLGASPTGLVHTEGSMRRLLGGIGYGDIELVHCLNGQTSFMVARHP